LLLLLRLLLWRFLRRTLAPPAAPAASAPFARRLIAFGSRRLLLLRLLRLCRTLRTLLLRRALAIALTLRTLSPAARAFLAWSALLFPRRHAGALLELAHLLIHVPPRLLFLLAARLVVAAVRATFPSLGIAVFARRTEDAFRQRHRNRRALYTSGHG
jgi:hypothetical protein